MIESISSTINYLLGVNHVTLGYVGVFAATLGLMTLAFIILPIQIKEATKNDGLRPTRLALPLVSVTIIFMFVNALWITFNRLMLQGQVGSVGSNDYRFFIGVGVGLLGLLLYIIYKRGGDPRPPTE